MIPVLRRLTEAPEETTVSHPRERKEGSPKAKAKGLGKQSMGGQPSPFPENAVEVAAVPSNVVRTLGPQHRFFLWQAY